MDRVKSAQASFRKRAGIKKAEPEVEVETEAPVEESRPDESWTKAQLVEWVEARGGQVASSATKAEILADIG